VRLFSDIFGLVAVTGFTRLAVIVNAPGARSVDIIIWKRYCHGFACMVVYAFQSPKLFKCFRARSELSSCVFGSEGN